MSRLKSSYHLDFLASEITNRLNCHLMNRLDLNNVLLEVLAKTNVSPFTGLNECIFSKNIIIFLAHISQFRPEKMNRSSHCCLTQAYRHALQ